MRISCSKAAFARMTNEFASLFKSPVPRRVSGYGRGRSRGGGPRWPLERERGEPSRRQATDRHASARPSLVRARRHPWRAHASNDVPTSGPIRVSRQPQPASTSLPPPQAALDLRRQVPRRKFLDRRDRLPVERPPDRRLTAHSSPASPSPHAREGSSNQWTALPTGSCR